MQSAILLDIVDLLGLAQQGEQKQIQRHWLASKGCALSLPPPEQATLLLSDKTLPKGGWR